MYLPILNYFSSLDKDKQVQFIARCNAIINHSDYNITAIKYSRIFKTQIVKCEEYDYADCYHISDYREFSVRKKNHSKITALVFFAIQCYKNKLDIKTLKYINDNFIHCDTIPQIAIDHLQEITKNEYENAANTLEPFFLFSLIDFYNYSYEDVHSWNLTNDVSLLNIKTKVCPALMKECNLYKQAVLFQNHNIFI